MSQQAWGGTFSRRPAPIAQPVRVLPPIDPTRLLASAGVMLDTLDRIYDHPQLFPYRASMDELRTVLRDIESVAKNASQDLAPALSSCSKRARELVAHIAKGCNEKLLEGDELYHCVKRTFPKSWSPAKEGQKEEEFSLEAAMSPIEEQGSLI